MAEEIDRLDQRIDQVTDQTLDATRRILRTAEETNQIGVDTLVTLNEQGEKLDNVERRLDEINVDLKKTDKNLSEIEKCCGCFSCSCKRSYKSSKPYKKTYGKNAPVDYEEDGIVSRQPGATQQDGAFVKRVTNDEREDEMEDNLQAVGSILDNLHGVAVDMGDELDRQNVQVGRINKKADVNVGHLSDANQRMRRQL